MKDPHPIGRTIVRRRDLTYKETLLLPDTDLKLSYGAIELDDGSILYSPEGSTSVIAPLVPYGRKT